MSREKRILESIHWISLHFFNFLFKDIFLKRETRSAYIDRHILINLAEKNFMVYLYKVMDNAKSIAKKLYYNLELFVNGVKI